jgi:hypothetical protein
MLIAVLLGLFAVFVQLCLLQLHVGRGSIGVPGWSKSAVSLKDRLEHFAHHHL